MTHRRGAGLVGAAPDGTSRRLDGADAAKRGTMHIDSYRFGRIVVDGEAFGRDLMLLPDGIEHPWWRAAGGHVFAPVDLQPLLHARIEIVVLGIGALGMVRVPEETRSAFVDRGIELVVERTGRAVQQFNELVESGGAVGAGFHLTC